MFTLFTATSPDRHPLRIYNKPFPMSLSYCDIKRLLSEADPGFDLWGILSTKMKLLTLDIVLEYVSAICQITSGLKRNASEASDKKGNLALEA